jgi:hypothetical protein
MKPSASRQIVTKHLAQAQKCSQALSAHKGDVRGKDVGYKGRNVRNITCTHLLVYGDTLGVRCVDCLSAFSAISSLGGIKVY